MFDGIGLIPASELLKRITDAGAERVRLVKDKNQIIAPSQPDSFMDVIGELHAWLVGIRRSNNFCASRHAGSSDAHELAL